MNASLVELNIALNVKQCTWKRLESHVSGWVWHGCGCERYGVPWKEMDVDGRAVLYPPLNELPTSLITSYYPLSYHSPLYLLVLLTPHLPAPLLILFDDLLVLPLTDPFLLSSFLCISSSFDLCTSLQPFLLDF